MTKFLGIVKEGNLISEPLWIKFIESLENNFDSLETNLERSKRKIAELFVESVKKRVVQKFGILFSGGVDSTTIAYVCQRLNCNFTCYTVGIENSDDIEWAKKIADEYKFNFKHKILTLDEYETALKETIGILGDADIVKASVGSVLYCAGKLALSNNDNILFGGLGSEEIFAGYKRHEDSLGQNNFEAVHKECWNGMKKMHERDLSRDFKIAKHLRSRAHCCTQTRR